MPAKQKRTIPSNNRGIQIRFIAFLDSTLDRVVFPFVAQRSYFESLVVVHRRSSPTATCREDVGKSTEQTTTQMNRRQTYVAVPLKKAVATRPSSQERSNFRKFSSVKRSLIGHGVRAVVVSDTKQTPAQKQKPAKRCCTLPWALLHFNFSRCGILGVLESVRKNDTTSSFPVFTTRVRNVCETIWRSRVKRNNGSVGFELVFFHQVHILGFVAVVCETAAEMRD